MLHLLRSSIFSQVAVKTNGDHLGGVDMIQSTFLSFQKHLYAMGTLIPQATHRNPAILTVVVSVHRDVVIRQEPVPGIARARLGRTPPETVAAHKVERSGGVEMATRNGSKSTFIGGSVIWGKP